MRHQRNGNNGKRLFKGTANDAIELQVSFTIEARCPSTFDNIKSDTLAQLMMMVTLFYQN